jgi:hypothetical protein
MKIEGDKKMEVFGVDDSKLVRQRVDKKLNIKDNQSTTHHLPEISRGEVRSGEKR